MSDYSRSNGFWPRLRMYQRVGGARAAFLALAGKCTGQTFTCATTIPNTSKRVNLRVPSSDVPVFSEVFFLREYEFPLKTPPSTIIDAGANVGLTSVYYANEYPSARIIAIEPEAYNYACLVEQVRPYANIKPLRAALWHKDEVVHIHDPGVGKWGFQISQKSNGASEQAVDGWSMESIMRNYELARVDLLKLDIEGAELEVLTASSGWIEVVDNIVAELHDTTRPGCKAAFEAATAGFAKRWTHGGHNYASRD